jgi:hypothetical protein
MRTVVLVLQYYYFNHQLLHVHISGLINPLSGTLQVVQNDGLVHWWLIRRTAKNSSRWIMYRIENELTVTQLLFQQNALVY